MKAFVATVVIASFLVGPVHAQPANNSSAKSPHEQAEAAKAEKERAQIEKDYNETIRQTRPQGAAPKSDPWARLRPANGADAKR
jgi:hypothetical protein